VIRSFRHKGLHRFFAEGDARGIRSDLAERVRSRLSVLLRAKSIADVDVPGFGLHALRGTPLRYSIRVNGPWRITFEWLDGDVLRVDLEQYH
jgi:proteic killer suppression protein